MYPFNPNATDCRLAAEKEGSKAHTNPSVEGGGEENEDRGGGEDSWREESGELDGYVPEELHFDPGANQIDSEKEELYKRRFEEGYDIYDCEYLEWLEKNHPESVPADRYTLVSASEWQPSIDDCFSHVTPVQPIDVDSVAATSNYSGQDTNSNVTATLPLY